MLRNGVVVSYSNVYYNINVHYYNKYNQFRVLISPVFLDKFKTKNFVTNYQYISEKIDEEIPVCLQEAFIRIYSYSLVTNTIFTLVNNTIQNSVLIFCEDID